MIVQVGGRFSGKSYNSEIEMAVNLANKDNYRLLVIEDLESGLAKGYYAGLKHKIELFGHDKAYSMSRSPVRIYNKLNKNEAIFSAFSSDQQKKSVKAIDQVTEIVVEEGEWLEYDDFVKLLHQLRGGRPEDRRLNIIMNPVNSDCFVNEMFIKAKPDKVYEYFEDEPNRPKVFEKKIVTEFEYEGKIVTDETLVLVVLSTHHDNPELTIDQRASIEALKKTDHDLYLQLARAKFINSRGAYFREFTRETHVIEPFPIPSHWNKMFTLDYGLDMLAGYWVAFDPLGDAVVYKELYESDLIISKGASRIKEYERDETIYQRYAPPDLYNRRQDTGKSAIDIFNEHGLFFYKAINDRVLGWYNLKEWLKLIQRKDEQTGEIITKPRLQVFSNCENLIRCLPKIQKDEKNPNDCAKEPHEVTHSCLTADTTVKTIDGDIQIKDLVGKTGSVYCYDEQTKSKTISIFSDVRMTEENATIYEVELADGTKVKATGDHKFLTNNGWKQLLELDIEVDEIIIV